MNKKTIFLTAASHTPITFKKDNDIIESAGADFTVRIKDNLIGYQYIGKNGGLMTHYLHSIPGYIINNDVSPEIQGNRIYWKDVVDGLTIYLEVTKAKAELWKILEHKDAPRKIQYTITKNGGQMIFDEEVIGHDANHNSIEIKTKKKKNFAFSTILWTEEWTGRISQITDKKTRLRKWGNNKPTYPITIDASITEEITVTADDCFVNIGSGYYSSYEQFRANSFLRAGHSYYKEATAGFRFQTLNIDQGATITSAILRLYVEYKAGSPELRIYGDDVDDADYFSASNLPTDISKTTSYVDWNPTATGSSDVDITDIVQEIVNRGSWASGNDIRFSIFNNKATSAFELVTLNEFGDANPAELLVTYSEGTPVTASISAESMTMTDQSVNVNNKLTASIVEEVLSMQDQAVTVDTGAGATATPESMTIEDQAANVVVDTILSLSPESMTLEDQAVNPVFSQSATATPEIMILSDQNITVLIGATASISEESMTMTDKSVNVNNKMTVSINIEMLTLEDQSVTPVIGAKAIVEPEIMTLSDIDILVILANMDVERPSTSWTGTEEPTASFSATAEPTASWTPIDEKISTL